MAYTFLRSHIARGSIHQSGGHKIDNNTKMLFTTINPMIVGTGYLAGEFPEGITSVEGAPVQAIVRVLLRESGSAIDGYPVAEVISSQAGTWRVDNLAMNRRYDVVARYDGHNDVIVSNVTPAED